MRACAGPRSGKIDSAQVLVRIGRRVGDTGMDELELAELRARARSGDRDAVDELIENGDPVDLRQLADAGNTDALDQLVQLAAENEDLTELRRLAEDGSTDAAEVLAELIEDDEDDDAER
jgi:hypothetical protein